jgi:integrase
MRAPTRTTLTEAAEYWLAAAESGIVRTRSGDPYKPSALRSYRQALESKVLPKLGHVRLSAVTRNHLQDLVDALVADGKAPSTVRNTILPVRAIYRRATDRDQVAINPTLKLRLPAVRGKRERTARADEAAALLTALADEDRALWATAFYTGLRRGELQALDWADIDFDHNLIHVVRAWDQKAGPISPKSRAGQRRVPIPKTLRQHLLTHRLVRHGRKTIRLGTIAPSSRYEKNKPREPNPRMPFPTCSTSPTWRPARTRRPSRAGTERIAAAQPSAAAGPRKVARSPSPVVSTSCPRNRSSSIRAASQCAERVCLHAASPTRTSVAVDPKRTSFL